MQILSAREYYTQLIFITGCLQGIMVDFLHLYFSPGILVKSYSTTKL